mgnify:FL=1
MMNKKLFLIQDRTTIVYVAFLLFFYSCTYNTTESIVKLEDIDEILPSAPTNLSAKNTTKAITDLSWTASTDNVGVTSYQIYKDDSFLLSTDRTSYTVSGLIVNTSYVFKVRAIDNAGNASDFSNSIDVTTNDNDAVLLTRTGDIETYAENIIDNVPDSSGNDYKEITAIQLDTWGLVIDAILIEDISEAVKIAAELNYQITEFTDETLTPNQVFYVLEEQIPKINHWGTYIFSKTPEIDYLVLQAPHILNDTNTGKQAMYCFKDNLAKAVFISGAHRCNQNKLSLCDGKTESCNEGLESYRVSDLAHNSNSAFQKTTEVIFNTISNSVFVQLHGFNKEATDPYVIMSNGTRKTPLIDYIVELRDALLVEDASLTFKIGHIDQDWEGLLSFENTQGRLINGSPEPCGTYATETSGRFIHIEQENNKLRSARPLWMKMSNAIKSVFK